MGFFDKLKLSRLKDGLSKTRETIRDNISKLTQGRTEIDDEFLEDLENILIAADVGVETTLNIVERITEKARTETYRSEDELNTMLFGVMEEMLLDVADEHPADFEAPLPAKPYVVLIVGVNGVGKTTSIAKMARYWESQGFGKALLAAGDTFRAAAIEQLKIQGERTGCRVVSQSIGSDPGAVIYDALESARARGEKIVIADTAGRLHNKKHLVRELEKINKVIDGRLQPGDRCCHLLVIDATTGQNGFQQAEAFHEAVGLDGIILTKYDSSARGGIVPSICRNLDIPFAFLGRGEGLDDWEVFNTENYLDDLLEGL